MRLFKKWFDPNLINLDEYENQLIVSKHKGGHSMPPPAIPGRMFGWNDEEMAMMVQNRRMAEEIYKRYNT